MNDERANQPKGIPNVSAALLGIGVSKSQMATRRLAIGLVIAVLLFVRFPSRPPNAEKCPSTTINIAVERLLSKQSIVSGEREASEFLKAHPQIRNVMLCREATGVIVATVASRAHPAATIESDPEVIHDLLNSANTLQKH